jgi:hypothetical protein
MVELGLLIAVIVGLGQVGKQLGVSAKYLPVISLVLGIVGGVFFADGEMANRVMTGIMLGLSASGLYDQSKLLTK